MEAVIMGRHREFDVDEALDAAVKVFWRKGYEGTTYTDLVEAIGVERPALYSAFGNKEALFLKALARYDERYLDYMPEALALPSAREVATRIIHQAIDLNTRFPEHTGCLGINGGLAVSVNAEPVRCALNEYRRAGQDRLRERFVQAKADSDLPETADPVALAAFVTTVTQGIAVQAKAGLDRETLELVANEALRCWPLRFSPSHKKETDAAACGAARSDENVSD
jgi:AcrR family transcriptional regulator